MENMKTLTIFYTKQEDGGVLARGICEDYTVFNNLPFASVQELAASHKHFEGQGYHVLYNCPDEWRPPVRDCLTPGCRRVISHHIWNIGYCCETCYKAIRGGRNA